MQELSYLQIDLNKIKQNATALRNICAGQKEYSALLCAVIKKNGYGLGAITIAKTLENSCCDMLAVYSAHEAQELVDAKIKTPILILGTLGAIAKTDPLCAALETGQLHVTAHSLKELENINQLAEGMQSKIPVHLFIDSGMSRSGMSASEMTKLVKNINTYKNMRIAGIYSHIACGDDDCDFTFRQLQNLKSAVSNFPDNFSTKQSKPLIHIANTFATLRDSDLHLDMIRPGLGLFGYGAKLMNGKCANAHIKLQPVVRWISHIIHAQNYKKNTKVGYGATHTLKRDSILAVVPVGYGDGYPFALSNKGTVGVQLNTKPGHDKTIFAQAPIVGKVNMDQIVLDLTGALEEYNGFDKHNDIQQFVGAKVEIISDNPEAPNSLENLAKLAGTHCYEMLCRISPQIKREYV